MALKLNALLEITAKVFGKENVQGLSQSLTGLEQVRGSRFQRLSS